MPLFNLLMTVKAPTPSNVIAPFVRLLANTIVKDGGVVRTVENLGVRRLPMRRKAKFADREGNRYFDDGRMINMRFDTNPNTLRELQRIVMLQEDVISNTVTREKDWSEYANVKKLKQNRFYDWEKHKLEPEP
mmetsp:Transcript_9944/g.20273  ORF Transcript_9944/g.20273 Transcript_9944/m.20273 type:complete len:133 (-) Transcript_9944:82-480(-)|eukprot:CAMPEP_0118659994 /NCGR_PEP_ID=MMETSP0785-20121206/15417_1 /TAXON_ID=91992 /ORGANISM="Bolidomonas pacifica, Strain CCMP 1866" /LENGTH=132 /DNA_ID=CAMNT_0006553153 /DNA_START=182 /DNA_END=580 /DNA_ORIENTATION=-